MSDAKDDKKPATEILADLSDKVDLLIRYYKNVDNNVKLILSRLNSLGTPAQQVPPTVQSSVTINQVAPLKIQSQDKLSVINKENFDNRAKTNKFSEFAAAHGIEVEEEESQGPSIVGFKNESSSDPNELTETSVRVGFQRGQRTPAVKNGPKATISQVLQKSDGSPLFLANVEITDSSGLVVKQSRTNTSGRWSAALSPGTYSVHVTKRFPADTNAAPIEATYNIDVPPSTKPMELNPLPIG
jgi:hypothetical protein